MHRKAPAHASVSMSLKGGAADVFRMDISTAVFLYVMSSLLVIFFPEPGTVFPEPGTVRRRPRGAGIAIAASGGEASGDTASCCRAANSALTSAGILSGHIMPCIVWGLNAAQRASIGI